MAYILGIIVHSYIAIVAAEALAAGLADPDISVDPDLIGFVLLFILPAVVVPLGIVILLFVYRRKFQVNAGRENARTLWRSSLTAAGSVVALYSVLWLLEGNYRTAGIAELLGQWIHLLVPFPMPFDVNLPQGLFSNMVYGFGGSVIWLLMLGLLFKNFRRYHRTGGGNGADIDRARALLRMGGGSLGWMALWENNIYWFSQDGNAAVAYQVHNGVALSIGGPFGDPSSTSGAAIEFVRYCTEHGLTPCFYSATEAVGAAVSTLGFRSLEVAEETLLNVRTMSFKGKAWQNVRTALNRAQRLNITDRWMPYSSMTPLIRAQLAEISEEWVADKYLPEMGFTLGGLEELKDPEVMCCVAIDDDGLVHGVTSWLPQYANGHVIGWTLDFMRRRAGAFKGVMEFLIASAVTHFREQVSVISLSASPLASLSTETHDTDRGSLDRMLTVLAQAVEPMYGMKSLAAFKSRFQPDHRTLYLYYLDPLALPTIGLALTSAYLPELSTRQSASILRRMTSRESARQG